MTEQTEIRIPYDDLKYVSVKCKCGTEITIDLSPRPKDQVPITWEPKDLKCTICGNPFDSKLKGAFDNFAHWLALVGESGMGDRVFFRVRKIA